MNAVEKLRRFLNEKNVDSELLEFKQSVHTVKEAADAANAKPEDFVKSITFVSEDRVVVGIVLGNCRVDAGKVSLAAGVKKLKMATPSQIRSFSGFEAGGVPPFGFRASFIADRSVFEKNIVYAGGGSNRALVRISPNEMLRVNEAVVADIVE